MENSIVDNKTNAIKIDYKYLPSPKFRLYRLENIESCWDFIENNSIERFVKTFCNETLTKVYRLMLFSSEIKLDNFFCIILNELLKENH